MGILPLHLRASIRDCTACQVPQVVSMNNSWGCTMANVQGLSSASSKPRAPLNGSRQSRIFQRKHICRQSIREFIRSECPLPGIGAAYREQPKDAVLESSVLRCGLKDLPCPGQRRLLKVSEVQLDSIITDKGQVRAPTAAVQALLAPTLRIVTLAMFWQ